MTDLERRHGEYKVPGGKLVVVDLHVSQGVLKDVHVSGDFFLEPPETLERLNAALEGQSSDASPQVLERALESVLDRDVMMYGITVEGVVTAVGRALA